ncbi:hypothetical protein EJ04DRAFT_563983 [Polyplosphaeria fusca]|uniref:Uncharacterized protein n=1 Tax=Polyplosphaeria fusca TaxID=682080 RepID=A0A9P4V2W8_9PLEO|nr:hypothetical protein EJ04DRAFT_563983 [Polyplosphaeria fusca]
MPGPPIGVPWIRDVGDNPNIARDEPPPPLYSGYPPHMVGIDSSPAPEPVTVPRPTIYSGPPILGPSMSPVMFGGAGFGAPGFAWHGGAPGILPMGGFGGGFGGGFNHFGGFGGFPFGGAPVGAGFFGPIPPDQTDPSQFSGGHLPGVTVFESDSHTVIGWVKSEIEPWLLPPGSPVTVEWIHVDSHWSIDRLIKSLRGRESDLPGWTVSEIREDPHSGMWVKGNSYAFGFGPASNNTLADVYWDKNRNRIGGGSLHVYLHRA